MTGSGWATAAPGNARGRRASAEGGAPIKHSGLLRRSRTVHPRGGRPLRSSP